MLKIKQLTKILFFTGFVPLIFVTASFIIWLLTDDQNMIDLSFFIMLFSAGFLLINSVFLAIYYGTARKQNNRQALNRVIFFVGLLLSNFVVDVITYNYMNYSSSTTTVVIENQARDVVKKIFLSSGVEKYFIAPVEPEESVSRALSFSNSGSDSGTVSYTFDLKGDTYRGIFIHDVAQSLGKKIKLVIRQNGRVSVQDVSE